MRSATTLENEEIDDLIRGGWTLLGCGPCERGFDVIEIILRARTEDDTLVVQERYATNRGPKWDMMKRASPGLGIETLTVAQYHRVAPPPGDGRRHDYRRKGPAVRDLVREHGPGIVFVG